jgi:hypothetical protein
LTKNKACANIDSVINLIIVKQKIMQKIFQQLVVTLSLATATGIFIHDGRIDKAVEYKPVPLEVTAQKIATQPHTHAEHHGKPIGHNGHRVPGRPPREHRMKRYMLQNYEPKGRHAFDNHFLPVVS